MFDFTKPTATSSHQRSKTAPYIHYPHVSNALASLTTDCSEGNETILMAPPVALTSRTSRTHLKSSSTVDPSQVSSYKPGLFDESFTDNQGSGHNTGHLLREESPPAQGLGLPSAIFTNCGEINFSYSPPDSPEQSPTKERWSFIPSLNISPTKEGKSEVTASKLAEWFQGTSEPVTIGIGSSASKDKADTATTSPVPKLLQRRSTLKAPTRSSMSPTRPAMASASKFSFFGVKPSPPIQSLSSANEDLANVDIQTALQPASLADPFSPSSFRNLLQHAEGLLKRLQTSYKQQIITLHEVTAEKEAQAEELEEARTRAEHLKLQLDDMTKKMAEQDTAMMNLVDEVAAQKKWRQDEEAKRSIRLVEESGPSHCHCYRRRTRKRPSLASTTSDSGSEFLSDDESPTQSIFSNDEGGRESRISYTSASSLGSPESVRRMHLPNACANCEGVTANEAAGIVGILKMENVALKSRVGYLEGALDGCLDLVQGLGV